jgi:hypothetical protein
MPDFIKTPEQGSSFPTDNFWSETHVQEPTFELFRTPDGVAYADILVRGHRETYWIRSKEFWRRLALYLQERTGEAPSAELKRRIELLEAKALQPESPVRRVYLRAASLPDRIYIDLADPSWGAMEIDADGWRIAQIPPVRFIRTPGLLPLPVPESGGSLDTLRNFLNVRDDDEFVLLVCWLLNALRHNGQHPVLVLTGAEGSAKSTLISILRALIDPNCAPLGGLPRTERELTALARSRYLQAFDNVSTLPVQLSDALCRLSTGGGAQPVILNSIADVVTRPDLADRCLFIDCDAIPEERRRSETELLGKFGKAHSQIFGLLLEALSYGLRMSPSTKPDRLPRMADFALWAIACEGAFWAPGAFSAAYKEHRAEAVDKLIGADPVASAIRRLAAKRSAWSGTASELDQYLRVLTGNLDFTKAWPPNPARLATRVRELAPSLDKVGVVVTFTRSGHDRTRLVTISAKTEKTDGQMGEASSARIHAISPSPPSAVPCGQVRTDGEGAAGGEAKSADSADGRFRNGSER